MDGGSNSKPTFNWLQEQAKVNRSAYDLILFTGDMAYDLESQDGQVGDQFLRKFQDVSAQWPLMLTPGNHETGNNSNFYIY